MKDYQYIHLKNDYTCERIIEKNTESKIKFKNDYNFDDYNLNFIVYIKNI